MGPRPARPRPLHDERALHDVSGRGSVERFASYLNGFSGKTQFIVITHRRGTMEAADMLYGVTMQEQGISKILALDLNQMEQNLNLITEE